MRAVVPVLVIIPADTLNIAARAIGADGLAIGTERKPDPRMPKRAASAVTSNACLCDMDGLGHHCLADGACCHVLGHSRSLVDPVIGAHTPFGNGWFEPIVWTTAMQLPRSLPDSQKAGFFGTVLCLYIIVHYCRTAPTQKPRTQTPMQKLTQNKFINMPNNGIAIAATGIAKTYTGPRGGAPKQALKGFDLDIPVGTVFGLLGPNGAGKSTFINIMAGTVIKSAGRVQIWGTDIDENPRQARANIGIVPQELNIDAYFTPRETLEMQAGLFGVKSSERRTDEILEAVGLTEQAHSYARRLSGGMRRRLLVAKAMVHSPPILVLDEPTAGVDIALRQRLWEHILSLSEDGVTIVLTTHYLEEAEALCDNIAIINHGQLVANKSKTALMAGARAKEVRLTLASGMPNDLPAALKALNARPAEGGIAVRYDPSASSVGAIIAAVATAGLEITDVTTDEPDLEEVFLKITGGTA